jgi:hypothetical protein
VPELCAVTDAPQQRTKMFPDEIEGGAPVGWKLIGRWRSEVEARVAGDDDDRGGCGMDEHMLAGPTHCQRASLADPGQELVRQVLGRPARRLAGRHLREVLRMHERLFVPSPTVQPGLSQPAEVRGSHAQVRVPEGRHVGVGCPTWLPRCRWAEELPLREVRYGLPEDAAGGGGQQVRAAVVVAEGLTRCTSLRRLGDVRAPAHLAAP